MILAVGLRVSNSHIQLCLIKLSKIIEKEIIIPVRLRKKVKLKAIDLFTVPNLCGG